MRRDGFGSVEVLLGLLLLAFLVRAAWGALVQLRGVGERSSEVAGALESVRVVWIVLGEELRRGDPGRDAWTAAGDSVSLRALRGGGAACPGPGGSELRILYRGSRRPDPRKDSVLVLGLDGVWTAHDLVRRSAGDVACRGALPRAGEVWELDPLPEGGLFALLFERGSYHLADSALRYRRGRGGRQPLTAPHFAQARLDAVVGGAGVEPRVRWEVRVGVGDGGAWRGEVWPRGRRRP